MSACKHSNLAAVQALLKHYPRHQMAQVDSHEADTQGALVVAAGNKNVPLLKLLLSHLKAPPAAEQWQGAQGQLQCEQQAQSAPRGQQGREEQGQQEQGQEQGLQGGGAQGQQGQGQQDDAHAAALGLSHQCSAALAVALKQRDAECIRLLLSALPDATPAVEERETHLKHVILGGMSQVGLPLCWLVARHLPGGPLPVCRCASVPLRL